MSKLPRISGEQAIRAFEKHGFRLKRIKGSHHILKKDGHRNLLSIPVHRGKTVGTGLLDAQIEAAGLTREQFIESL
jgi:predicted RNA binding protein YcfA (HicA-like mRNA interferase family)